MEGRQEQVRSLREVRFLKHQGKKEGASNLPFNNNLMFKIQKKRIRSLKKYAPILSGRQIILAVDLGEHKEVAQRTGFSVTFPQGETILPAVFGPVTKVNAFGKEIVRKDLPKETHYRQVEWEWQQWSGYRETITRREVKDVPYEKFPRDYYAPQGVTLKIAKDMIVSPAFNFPQDEEVILHTVNIFLEIFGECRLLNKDLKDFISVPAKPLNWKVLPSGEMPWKALIRHLEPIFRKANPQGRAVFMDRLDNIEAHKPDFRAFGVGGYEGYVVFGFKKRKLYLCESIHHGNAIYVFDENWEEFSKRTKAEVIQRGLMKERIIHYGTWKRRIREILGSEDKLLTESAVQGPRSITDSKKLSKESVLVSK